MTFHPALKLAFTYGSIVVRRQHVFTDKFQQAAGLQRRLIDCYCRYENLELVDALSPRQAVLAKVGCRHPELPWSFMCCLGCMCRFVCYPTFIVPEQRVTKTLWHLAASEKCRCSSRGMQSLGLSCMAIYCHRPYCFQPITQFTHVLGFLLKQLPAATTVMLFAQVTLLSCFNLRTESGI